MNTIIDSVQQEDSKRASPVRVGRAYIKDRPTSCSCDAGMQRCNSLSNISRLSASPLLPRVRFRVLACSVLQAQTACLIREPRT